MVITDTSGSAHEWYYRAQHIVSQDGSTRYTTVDEWSPFGLGWPSPALLGWTPDGGAAYVLETGICDGCDLVGWGERLRRVDLASGEIASLYEGYMYAPAPSPDLRKLIFGGDHSVVLHDLATGTEAAVSMESMPTRTSAFQVGGWRWSPSEERVAFSVTSDPCNTMGIAVLHASSMRLAVLLPESEGDAMVIAWDAEDALLVRADPLAYTDLGGSPTPPLKEQRLLVPGPVSSGRR